MTDICQRRFVYRRACETDIRETLIAHGWRPTTEEQRRLQQMPPELRREHGPRVALMAWRKG